jgi:hypothetical protein
MRVPGCGAECVTSRASTIVLFQSVTTSAEATPGVASAASAISATTSLLLIRFLSDGPIDGVEEDCSCDLRVPRCDCRVYRRIGAPATPRGDRGVDAHVARS